MIVLKFPPIHKGLARPDKDMEPNDPRRGIMVLKDFAFIIQDGFCFVINLFEYFTLNCNIEDENDIKELKKILFFMNGKSFNKDFWTELTKGTEMEMHNGSLHLQNPQYSKDLHYEEIDLDMMEPLQMLLNSFELKEDLVSAIGVYYNSLEAVYRCLPNDFKTDVIIMQFSSTNKNVKFTFRKNKHCFGYFISHYESVQDAFRFEHYENFVTSDLFKSTIKEFDERKKVESPPLPPLPPINSVPDENPNQMKINDGEQF